MKIKKGYAARKVGAEYMVVPMGQALKEFNGVIRMNETGYFLWNELENGCTEDELVSKMIDNYEGLGEEQARTDLREFLESVRVAIEE